jgi:hypothetical protein
VKEGENADRSFDYLPHYFPVGIFTGDPALAELP